MIDMYSWCVIKNYAEAEIKKESTLQSTKYNNFSNLRPPRYSFFSVYTSCLCVSASYNAHALGQCYFGFYNSQMHGQINRLKRSITVERNLTFVYLIFKIQRVLLTFVRILHCCSISYMDS